MHEPAEDFKEVEIIPDADCRPDAKTVRVSEESHKALVGIRCFLESKAIEGKAWAMECYPPASFDSVIKYLVQCHLWARRERERR